MFKFFIRLSRQAFLPLCVITLLTQHCSLAGILAPPGVLPGETYQLVFVTSAGRDATDPNIQAYNNFVQGIADGAGIGNTEGVQWKAIASTETVHARDNALVAGRVFDTVGNLVADDFSDMWDGDIDSFRISYDENSNLVTSASPDFPIREVWTGTLADGTSAGFSGALGSAEGPTSRATVGNALDGGQGIGESAAAWIDIIGLDATRQGFHRLYALSQPITVAVVPEPSGALFCLLTLVVTTSRLRTKRQLQRRPPGTRYRPTHTD